ncbi:MAG: preprotein translocase subunit SecA [Planctomycetales bacterium]|nr:preprotein translocase subunit SecA [Planctomycetales bacterium]NIO72536.1 preprotein translocase subunit SecA [Anaerolineae bacterium]NIQ19084.1 preprotein translocase subunit SecA [Gammaproteobacteria bacterium]NIM09738.1 preprotein translocase subunit SecA [Planctomycetales bacterium]NIN78310.1 preprotein translocase subunit SecA [Planctomycetales bacterium]
MIRLQSYRGIRHTLWPRCHQPRSSDWQLVHRIRQHAVTLESCREVELRERMAALRSQVMAGADLFSSDLVVPSFALTYEAVRRVLHMEYYEVQLLAGLVLASGAIAEMQTGEGKTLVAALPATLHALTGKGVHVATVNNYLAQRDYELLRPALKMLGLSVGLVEPQVAAEQKKAAYDCDITYAAGYQLGFDYLHDQIVLQQRHALELGQEFRNRLRNVDPSDALLMQRGHALAVLDEIDSVLIDEATMPLILSGAPSTISPPEVFQVARDIAATLVEDQDFFADPRAGHIGLTHAGLPKINAPQTSPQPYGLTRPWTIYIENALRAQHFLRRNVDYILQDDKVLIVDQYTGRIFSERTWRDGLHQAVEAKEHVPITKEKCAIARISRQRYFRMYEMTCGMTGTARGNEVEFARFYQLPVVEIPLRKPSQRAQLPTRYFADKEAKLAAVAEDVAARHRRGQPVLIGTRTIEDSLQVAAQLDKAGLPYRVLNGVQDEQEAELVAAAGQPGAITIATNMAGRGTDIKVPHKSQLSGGLHVIAMEHQPSARIDRQLIGRSARQGEPGSCQFMIASDDELLRRYDPKLQQRIRQATGNNGNLAKKFSRPIAKLQHKCERRDYLQRCQLLKQESWLENVLATMAKED